MLSTQKTYNKNKKIIKKQFKLCITKNNRKRYEVDRHMIENVFERRRKMNEHEYSNAIVHAFQKFRVLPQLSVNGIETKVLK